MDRYVLPEISSPGNRRINDASEEMAKLAEALGMPPASPSTPRASRTTPSRTSPRRRELPIKTLFPSETRNISQSKQRWKLRTIVKVGEHQSDDDGHAHQRLAIYGSAGAIAISVKSRITFWSNQSGALPTTVIVKYRSVLSMSFSCAGLLAVAYSDSTLCIYNLHLDVIVAKHFGARKQRLSRIAWYKGSSTHLLAGDETGAIRSFELVEGHSRSVIIEHNRVSLHEDAITTLADNGQGMLATGSLGGDVAMLDSQALTYKHKHLYSLKYHSAIRALDFCEWAPNLLAVGGSSIGLGFEIWDTASQTLVHVVRVPGPIVSLIWLGRWDIFVAFGKMAKNQLIGEIYSLPEGKPVGNLRLNGYTIDAVRTERGVCIFNNEDEMLFVEWDPDLDPCNMRQLLDVDQQSINFNFFQRL